MECGLRKVEMDAPKFCRTKTDKRTLRQKFCSHTSKVNLLLIIPLPSSSRLGYRRISARTTYHWIYTRKMTYTATQQGISGMNQQSVKNELHESDHLPPFHPCNFKHMLMNGSVIWPSARIIEQGIYCVIQR